MTTLSPEQIAYIVEWWRSGNEWRRPILVGSFPDGTLHERWGGVDGNEVRLTDAGITLAKMAIALEQASGAVEELLAILSGEFGYKELTQGEFDMVERVRDSKLELLG